MASLGIEQGQSTFVGIYAQNMPEWWISALGNTMNNNVTVPLYDSLGADASAYIVQKVWFSNYETLIMILSCAKA